MKALGNTEYGRIRVSSFSRGFTLIEMLVVVGIIGILASMLMPALSRAKQKANRIACLNHMRQLGLSMNMYASDHDGQYPPRWSAPTNWISRLQPYYKDPKIIKCSSDSFTSPRSYVINGWNDYFESNLAPADYLRFKGHRLLTGMKESAIIYPSETIMFGEKKTKSMHVHMDFFQGKGNDVEEIEQNRHRSGDNSKSGGSNYSFADGSSRFLKYGESTYPVNLWAITDAWRNAAVKVQ